MSSLFQLKSRASASANRRRTLARAVASQCPFPPSGRHTARISYASRPSRASINRRRSASASNLAIARRLRCVRAVGEEARADVARVRPSQLDARRRRQNHVRRERRRGTTRRERVRATRLAHDENRDGRRGRTGAATTRKARGTRSSANEGRGGPREKARGTTRARGRVTRAKRRRRVDAG